jgi:hypothetical protein
MAIKADLGNVEGCHLVNCPIYDSSVSQLSKVAISKHFTVNQAQTLIEAQSLIKPLNRQFWVGAVNVSALFYHSSCSF